MSDAAIVIDVGGTKACALTVTRSMFGPHSGAMGATLVALEGA